MIGLWCEPLGQHTSGNIGHAVTLRTPHHGFDSYLIITCGVPSSQMLPPGIVYCSMKVQFALEAWHNECLLVTFSESNVQNPKFFSVYSLL